MNGRDVIRVYSVECVTLFLCVPWNKKNYEDSLPGPPAARNVLALSPSQPCFKLEHYLRMTSQEPFGREQMEF